MDMEWDERKARTNLEKHGVDFADAVAALEDPCALTTPDDSSEEVRFASLGLDSLGRLLVVVYTIRGERIRLISARRANRREARQYEDGP
ncbi:BrnT family toxin [Myxococcota bacterium]|nr:BrnT family toxin [Myxococcota bacterium]